MRCFRRLVTVHRRDAEGAESLLFLFCSERAQNKKIQPCGAYRLMKLVVLKRFQACRRRKEFFRCRPSCPETSGITGNGKDFPLCGLCASDERSEWAVNYYVGSSDPERVEGERAVN